MEKLFSGYKRITWGIKEEKEYLYIEDIGKGRGCCDLKY